MKVNDHSLAAKRTEATYARREKRWCNPNGKAARIASKAYNKADRRFSRKLTRELM